MLNSQRCFPDGTKSGTKSGADSDTHSFPSMDYRRKGLLQLIMHVRQH